MKTQIAKPLLAACTFIASAFILATPAEATAPNTTAANSVAYEVGQGWVTHYFDEATQNRWFRFGAVGGHSYCVEAVQGSVSPIQLDPNLAIYSDASGATLLTPATGAALTNNDGGGDPNFIKGSRICYIEPTPASAIGVATTRSIRLNVPVPAASGDAGYIRLRVVDTTTIAATAGQKSTRGGGYVYLSNKTGNLLNVRLTFRSEAVLYPYTYLNSATACADCVLINAEGYTTVAPLKQSYRGYAIDLSSLPYGDGGYIYGFTFIAHDGPPGALGGSVFNWSPQYNLEIK